MAVTNRSHSGTRTETTSERLLPRLLRVVLLCLVIATTGACSFVEELQPGDTGYVTPGSDLGSIGSGGNGGGGGGTGTGSGGGGSTGSGGGSVVPAVVPYTARWMPSPSAGVIGYELDVDILGGGNYRRLDIPTSATSSTGSGQLAYALDLETRNDYVMTLRAYSADSTSPPSNAITVYGIQLIVNAGSAGGSIAGGSSGSPSAAMAAMAEPVSGSSLDSSLASSSDSTATSSTSSQSASTAPGDADAADTAQQALELDWLSLDFDGSGAHLAGAIDDARDASAITITTWLRPVVDGTEPRSLVSVVDDGGVGRLDVRVVNGAGIHVSLRDAAGSTLLEAGFADVLEHDLWQHVALVIDPAAASPARLVVGGTTLEPVTLTATAAAATPAELSGTLRIGGSENGDGYVGRMGHTAVFTRALDAAEIDEIDAAGHGLDLRSALAAGASAEALLHYWRLGEGVGVESDLGTSVWPVDLVPTSDGVLAVEDAPLPIE